MKKKKKQRKPKKPLKKKKKSIPVLDTSPNKKKDKNKNKDKDKNKRDKIFENKYNVGDVETESLPPIRIETDYASSLLDDCYNAETYMEKKALLEKVFEIFKASQWKTLPLNKKFPKELMPFIFIDLYKGLDGRGHSTIDIFICIAEFMDISYERVYEIAGLRAKEKLIKELEDKYKVLSRKKINRLF